MYFILARTFDASSSNNRWDAEFGGRGSWGGEEDEEKGDDKEEEGGGWGRGVGSYTKICGMKEN